MRKKERRTVAGIHAPRPRPTPWAALLVSLAVMFLLLVGLGHWRIAALLLG